MSDLYKSSIVCPECAGKAPLDHIVVCREKHCVDYVYFCETIGCVKVFIVGREIIG